MRYDTEQMMFVGTAVTAEETAALGLHYEIIAAAQTAAAGLLDMARKIKRMRDTGGYKALGFESLEAYTQATMGMRQRQAYNYISIAEKLPAQLIEQNAAAGVTKLALLASLTAGEQKQITAETDLAGTTVTALKRQIRELQEKNTGYAQQLSLLQANAEDDRQTARQDAQETVRRELEAALQRQKEAEAAAEQDRKERDATRRWQPQKSCRPKPHSTRRHWKKPGPRVPPMLRKKPAPKCAWKPKPSWLRRKPPGRQLKSEPHSWQSSCR